MAWAVGIPRSGPSPQPDTQVPGQTVPNLSAAFALQPLGNIPRAALDRQAKVIEARFGERVEVLPARPLPEEAWSPEREQYRAGAILDELYIRKPAGVTHIIGITAHDLYEDGWEYLYGFSQVEGNVAIVSMRRTWTPRQGQSLASWRLAVDRSEKVLVHELGHSLSLGHCSRKHCVMSAVDTSPSLDRLSRFYCRRCAAAIESGPVDEQDPILSRGDGLYHRGSHHRALVRYVTAALQNPMNAHRINRVGVASAPILRPLVAGTAFRFASHRDPSDPLPWYNMGLLHAHSDAELATRLFRAGFERDPDRVEALGFLGLVYADVLEDEHEALRHFQRYVGEGGNSPAVLYRYRQLLTPSLVVFEEDEGSVIEASVQESLEERATRYQWVVALDNWLSE